MTHSIVEPPKGTFHHSLVELPQEKFHHHNRIAQWNSRIATITLVATLAIGAAILCFTFLATSTPLPLILFGITLSLPFLGFYHKKCVYKSFLHENKAEIEQGVLKELSQLKDSSAADIEKILLDVGIEKKDIPLELLGQLNPKEPIKALLPVIARTRYLVTRAMQVRNTALKMIHQKEISDSTLLKLRQQGWGLIERESLPCLFEAAILYHVLTHPDTQIELKELGKIKPRSLEERLSMNFFDEKDTYFVFDEESKEEISFDSLKSTSAQDLHNRLFALT